MGAHCDDCTRMCRDGCQKITAGAQPYWAAFELSGSSDLFICWSMEQWRAWRIERGVAEGAQKTEAQHRDYHDWLMARYGVPSAWWLPERRAA